MKDIKNILKKQILTLDGAMGSLIQTHSLSELDYRSEILSNHPQDLKGNHDILSLTRPDIIHNIHSLYLEAGADIIVTGTLVETSNKLKEEMSSLIKIIHSG